MALKYPNKKKRKGYYKIYELAGTNSRRKVWGFLDEIINEIGIPFGIPKRGAKPKLDRKIYAKMVLYLTYFDVTLREMEDELYRFEENSIDFSNIDRWFMKADDCWVKKATQLLHEKLESMFRKACYISDSTKITTTQYYETTQIDSEGNRVIELMTMKLHILIVYFFAAGIISIANFHVTHGDANDNPIMNENLLENVKIRKGRKHHADKGYWSVENIRKNKLLGLIPNIVPKDGFDKGLTLKTAIQEYDKEERKKRRGLIEGIFGGITVSQGTQTRFRLDRTRKLHIALLALTHEIKTYFRAITKKAIAFFFFTATTPSFALSF
jgi:hypothetical protein